MLKEWITNIIVCSILFSILLYLVPDPKMKRYIQTAVGLVMMIVVISPVIRWLDSDGHIEFNMYTEAVQQAFDETDTGVYVDLMENVVQNFLMDKYGIGSEVRIVLSSDMEIDAMDISVQEASQQGDAVADGSDMGEMKSGGAVKETVKETVKEILAQEYGVPPDRISVK